MPPKTLIIDNFQGRLTRYKEGDINSGFAKYNTTFGNDPFTNPGNLTWFEQPIRIDPDASVITDIIMAQKVRLESGITYVYAVGHTGRFYKIQVNDPSTFNPNYDNPVLLTTLTASSPTFKYGASIQFFGATEKVYIGHDVGVTSVNFDGTGEAFIGATGANQWVQNVPRMSVNFTGILYWTNGTNIAAIDSTATVTNYQRLSPGFPVGTQARDIDVNGEGNYVYIVVARVPQPDMTVTTQDTNSLSSGDSYFIGWNGTDPGYTTYNPFNSYSINAHLSYGQNSALMGYDLGGAAIYQGSTKMVSLPLSNCPVPQALFSISNLLGFAAPEQAEGVLTSTILVYGAYDQEIPLGLYRFFRNDTLEESSTAATLPGSGTNVTGIGDAAWDNPSRITADDGSFSESGLAGGGAAVDYIVSLVKSDGIISTTNKASSIVWTENPTLSVGTYGGSSDLWGEVWTADDINSSNFGAVLVAGTLGGSDYTNYLKGSDFGFAIPVDSTIKGIELTIERNYDVFRFPDPEPGDPSIGPRVDYFKITVYYANPAVQPNAIQIPSCQVVSNLLFGSSLAGYDDNIIGSAKLYFSSFEATQSGLDQYRFYKFTTFPTGDGTTIQGVYETQNQFFSKKVEIKEVRVYCDPLLANNSLTVDLIGSSGNPMDEGSKTFTVGQNDIALGQDYLWYTPSCAPTYSVGVRVTNLGSVNNVINKIEIDYTGGGQ